MRAGSRRIPDCIPVSYTHLVILVSGLGFSDGLTFTIGSTSITLTSLAIAAIAGIVLNAILPGNDYAFGKDPEGDASRGVDLRPHELEQELKNQK